MDCIINAIDDWFNQENFKTYIKLENILLKATKGSKFDSKYESDFDGIWLNVQLETPSEYCKETVETRSAHTVTIFMKCISLRS